MRPFKKHAIRKALVAAYAERDRAGERLRDAVWRKDTQAQKRAHEALRKATHNALALENKHG